MPPHLPHQHVERAERAESPAGPPGYLPLQGTRSFVSGRPLFCRAAGDERRSSLPMIKGRSIAFLAEVAYLARPGGSYQAAALWSQSKQILGYGGERARPNAPLLFSLISPNITRSRSRRFFFQHGKKLTDANKNVIGPPV